MAMLFGGNFQVSEITKYGILIGGIYILSALLNYFQGFCMSKVAVRLSKKLRSDIIKKINTLPLNYFDKHSYGDILSRVTNDVDTISNTLQRTLSSLITSSVTVIGIPIIMFTLNWQLTLVALLQIPLALIVIFIVVKNNQKYFVKQQDYIGDVNGYVEENFSAHTVVKAFNGKAKSQAEFDKINNNLKTASRKAQFFSGILHPMTVFSSNIVYVLICLVGGYIAVQTNDVTFLATIGTFMTYTKLFNQPIQQIEKLQRHTAARRRTDTVHKRPDQRTVLPVVQHIVPRPMVRRQETQLILGNCLLLQTDRRGRQLLQPGMALQLHVEHVRQLLQQQLQHLRILLRPRSVCQDVRRVSSIRKKAQMAR